MAAEKATAGRLIAGGIIGLVLFFGQAMTTEAQSTSKENSREVQVNIRELRNSKGVVGVALFKAAQGFPEDSSQAFATINAEIRGAIAVAIFRGVPPGTYAVSVRHDENENGKLDKNMFGVPKEGWGASNNPKVKLRAPRFEEAQFQVRAEDTIAPINIILRY